MKVLKEYGIKDEQGLFLYLNFTFNQEAISLDRLQRLSKGAYKNNLLD
jgi:hypothetical protein